MKVLEFLMPYAVGFAVFYLIGSFIEWSWNPGSWSWNVRCVISIFGMGYGFALSVKMEPKE
jgi:hypothetical protein